jgi:hypothetical protein
MILRLLKGRGMVSGLFEKKQDVILPHPAPPQALPITVAYHTEIFRRPCNKGAVITDTSATVHTPTDKACFWSLIPSRQYML